MEKPDLAMTWEDHSVSEHWERSVSMWSLGVECAAVHLRAKLGVGGC